MPENSRLPIFERWADRYDQSVQTDKGLFASYSLVLAEVVRAAQVKAGMRVLELGIGTGNLAQKFVTLGCEVWGVDFSPAMLAKARVKVPQVKLLQMDLTADWPEALRQRFDRIVANFVIHEFDLATKISLLRRLAKHHLVDQGLIVIGDVAFPTAEARRQSGAESWDEDEYYWAADETITACAGTGLEVAFKQISWCTGVFVVKLASLRKGSLMNSLPLLTSSYHSFLLRLWREEGAGGPTSWQGEIESIQTGRKWQFDGPESIIDFLRTQMSADLTNDPD